MGKKNVTAQYIRETRPQTVRNVPLPSWQPPKGRMLALRLSWTPLANKIPYDFKRLVANYRAGSYPDQLFFLDTSFITGQEVPGFVWSLLRDRHVVIPPLTLAELEPWLANPFYNSSFRDDVAAALVQPVDYIWLLDFNRFPWFYREAGAYYRNLLAHRKRAGFFVASTLRRELGREPTPEEVRKRLQRVVHDRGLQLAMKGMSAKTYTARFADEELVVWAALTALYTGREVSIFSRDTDVIEQFYKFIYLLDTHYRGALIAEMTRHRPFRMYPMTDDECEARGLFNSGKMIELDFPMFGELPETWHGVNFSCYVFGGPANGLRLTALSFQMEYEMTIVLEAKALGLGRNTLVLGGGLNCHRVVEPHNQDIYGRFAAVVEDRWFGFAGTRFAALDEELALLRIEGTTHATTSTLVY